MHVVVDQVRPRDSHVVNRGRRAAAAAAAATACFRRFPDGFPDPRAGGATCAHVAWQCSTRLKTVTHGQVVLPVRMSHGSAVHV